MPKTPRKLPPREIEICHRLRLFRDFTKISRAAFSVSIGIGTERLASYENARAPLRWGIYTRIAEEYSLSPNWLATGGSNPINIYPPKELWSERRFDSRQLFSEVYDTYLKKVLEERTTYAIETWKPQMTKLRAFAEKYASGDKSVRRAMSQLTEEELEQGIAYFREIIARLKSERENRERYKAFIDRKESDELEILPPERMRAVRIRKP